MRINVRFDEIDSCFPVSMDSDDDFAVDFGASFVHTEITGLDYYDGEYDITPMVTTQVLSTREKAMRDDVIVRMIPTHELPNEQGGVTFILG